MSAVDEVKFSLRVMVNKDKTKVLFANVDSDFADVLLSFLTLPFGTILRIFDKHYGDEDVPIVLGSLNSLRKGLSDLDDVHFCTKEGKMMLLNPIRSSESVCSKLKLNIDYAAQPTKYFACEDMDCYGHRSGVGMYFDTSTACCQCGKSMNIKTRDIETHSEAANNENGVFSKKNVSFAISDDLQIAPNVTGSIIQIIRNFGIMDVDGVEQMNLTIGLNEIMDLLKLSLESKTPLTDLVLNKRPIYHLKFESTTSMCKMEEESNAKKIVIKAIIQRTTKKLLFAIAKDNFIDFLFSLLTIPLGGVINLLGVETPLGSISNLYRSIQTMDGDEYLKTKDIKSMLLNPQLAPMYISKNQILPLVEQNPPLLYFHPHEDKKSPWWYFHLSVDHEKNCFRSYKLYKIDHIVSFKDPKGEGSYVKGPGMFMVSDDLTVTPLSMLSSVSILNGLKIPLSEVEEKEFEIGLEEALSILRASLGSTSALTDGLRITSVFMKKPKEEQ